MEEKRELNISFNKSGSGSYTPRISLPATWINEMGIDKENRKVSVTFKDGKIIIYYKNLLELILRGFYFFVCISLYIIFF